MKALKHLIYEILSLHLHIGYVILRFTNELIW